MWDGAEKCLLRDLDRSEETCLLSFIFGGNETSLQDDKFEILSIVSFEVQHGFQNSKVFRQENSLDPFVSQFKPRGLKVPWALDQVTNTQDPEEIEVEPTIDGNVGAMANRQG